MSHGVIVRVQQVDYEVLHTIGKGGSSTVFCALRRTPTLAGAGASKADPLVALKYVRGSEHTSSLRDEIRLLKSLKDVPWVAQYLGDEIDASVAGDECGAMVMELGSVDLSRYLAEHRSSVSTAGGPSPTRAMIRNLWESMLTAVQGIHDARVVHGDLKPANFVFVRGMLKVIDFGIAKGIRDDTVNITRDTQTGTLNYIPPEALLPATGSDGTQFKLSVKADVWSLGCILYMLVYGSPPFQDVTPLARKVSAIISPQHAIKFPSLNPPVEPALYDVMSRCLQRDPSLRPTTSQLLAHPYLAGSPAATPRGVSDLVDLLVQRADTLAGLYREHPSSSRAFSQALVRGLMTTTDVERALSEALRDVVASAANAGRENMPPAAAAAAAAAASSSRR